MFEIVAVIKFTYELLLLVDHLEPAVVIVDVPVVIHQAHVQRRHRCEAVHLDTVLLVEVVEHLQAQLGVLDDLVDRRQSVLAPPQESIHVGGGEVLVHAAGHCGDTVHALTENGLDDFLAPPFA